MGHVRTGDRGRRISGAARTGTSPSALENAPESSVVNPFSRRRFLHLALSTAAGLVTGCSYKRCQLAKDVTYPDLITHLNHNTDQIDSWRSDKVSIKVQGGMILAPSLSAMIAIQRPRNFRLQATMPLGGGNLVDLGSNDDCFWFWARNDEEPAILTARHDCLAAAQRQLPIPFEPDWLLDTLGVIPIDPDDIECEKHPKDPKLSFLRRHREAPDGTPVQLVSTVDTCQGVITEHSLSDQSGSVIAVATLGDHYRDGKTGIILPHRVDLSWPRMGMGLKLTMGAIEVNPSTITAHQFTMPQIANCPVYDIGAGGTQQVEFSGGRAKI